MKLAWFAGTTLRIHIGGQILVSDPDGAPAFVDRTELVAGADRIFDLGGPGSLPLIDAARWRPRKPQPVIDEPGVQPSVALALIGDGAVLVDALGEPPLVLIRGAVAPGLGRWANEAVVVLFGLGRQLVATSSALLKMTPPKLIALAADEAAVDFAIGELRDHLDGTALVSLEPGMALEV